MVCQALAWQAFAGPSSSWRHWHFAYLEFVLNQSAETVLLGSVPLSQHLVN